MKKSTIYIGADHAGWKLKEILEEYLKKKEFNVIDMGNQNLVDGDDYPDFGYAVAKRVVTDEGSHGIVICGNAQGICIVANKVRGARAATGFNTDVAKSAREDDNSNVLCLPGRHINTKEAKAIVDMWLTTEFSGEDRHVRRLKRVQDIENQEFGL
ncbi:ribose-5-phosphate isomerase [Candidatus Uhrbacteria bacterium CG10_big_fil_rev_8_21_14_0_10_48_16]|uniref:Ribose-5-phosphate isomerase n=1 Tax=Candidatus Uhrbacteria bacterium CG10_big_fil_rev_8_21_14_0_10_48_16 TaxID=1975038 RepID=A0A2M8LHM8_9BACT|nr:MAG: ribose-5-phosphate isomerase [Candidatus Uhrbacteria bacterium CG10_big_fil_rev_8_21_14_0_10_48_16]